MNFGTTFAVGSQNISITGATQVFDGINKDEDTQSFDITIQSPFSTEKKNQTTLGNKTKLDSAFFVHGFKVNPMQYKDLVDKEYEALYEKAKSLKNVNYKGYTHHKDLIKVLHNYDIFVYPNHWEETSCIAAIEALACGQVGLITNNGALYETCAEFPIYVPYLTDKKMLVDQFAFAIDTLPEIINNVSDEQIKFQMEYYKKFYHWSVIKTYWERFLNGI
jgi:glycosyltransferase involved in cell wall biosynthesis